MEPLRFNVRLVETFSEPAFSQLQRLVFADVQRESDELDALLRAEAAAEAISVTHPPMHRLGAYIGEELVGWSNGWMERGRVFYMANSGVAAAHRRKGVYTALLSAVRDHASSQGVVTLRSQHSVLNNAVIIAKLRFGFHICGLSQSAQMGTLVELVHHLSQPRREIFRGRAIPFVARPS
ncbi:MAG: GNAT family N-acetyltransferase [Ramlibacter sp.]|nr:GNAT family N-acetyltransferase [Ramlibacter sp.]